MSQKTNPLSLRLQKNNQNFSSPWFADFFFNEIYHYGFQVENYIAAFFRETQYSKAFFSAKNSYRKFHVFLMIQDIRALKREKQLSFKLKPSFSARAPCKLSLFPKSQSVNISIPKNFTCNTLNKSEENKLISNDLLPKICFDVRKKIKNNFLKLKQSYNFALLQKAVATRNLNSGYTRTFTTYDKNVAHVLRKNDCFSFCEKIISDSTHLKEIFGQTSFKFQNLQSRNTNSDSSAIKVFSPDNFAVTSFKNKLVINNTQHRTKAVLRFSQNTNARNYNLNCFSPVILNFQPIRFISDHQNVVALLDQIVLLLEKRISFRQIKSKLFQELSKNLQIKGVRISCSGRLGGRSKKAQKAKMQSDQWGETSLNAFSSKVVFASKSAFTSYGKIGVKIWLSFESPRC